MSAELNAKIAAVGDQIRQLKVAKADAVAIKAAVAELLALKTEWKAATGAEWKPPAAAGPPAAPAAPAAAGKKEKDAAKPPAVPAPGKSKGDKKDDKKQVNTTPVAPVYVAPKGMTYYPCVTNASSNMKCLSLSAALKVKMAVDAGLSPDAPRTPVLSDKGGQVVRFGANAICRYLSEVSSTTATSSSLGAKEVDMLLDAEEEGGAAAVSKIEACLAGKDPATCSSSALVNAVLYPVLKASGAASAACQTIVAAVEKGAGFAEVQNTVSGGVESLENFDYANAGLLNSLKTLFSHAILNAFPAVPYLLGDYSGLQHAVITRCANANFGDFQCNSAMGLAKALKVSCPGYTGSTVPKDIAAELVKHLPTNDFILKVAPVPNGFINITLRTDAIQEAIAGIVANGPQPPFMTKKRVIVDFSSPNIAKEMHVGHLRSTIIGDAVCRILEFCGHDVLRTNHVGDWGTQFGMLITYLKEAYPDLLTNPPNITDLTVIYKASKKRFDDDADFKDRARLAVVSLQSGDPDCRAIWNLLCDISRKEFQNVYDLLDIKLEEVGESFYNPMIPGVIELCTKCGIVQEEEKMLIIKLPHFTIPLIVRKSDGGYGYDSTDMAAIHYRLFEKNADWIIYITDAGQAPHFYMVFDAARAAGWIDPVRKQRLDHIGFGVVCGDDGKRFKTRSSETVRLIDLLNAAKERMQASLQQRADEGKAGVAGAELEESAAKIGYGAVKYFDLKQNPNTNYIFSYDRMLDTKGDTAVYLMFAYARLASILKKAEAEKGIDLVALKTQALATLVLKEEAERMLAFELMQLGDVLKSVLKELLPNRLCDYLQGVCVKFTDFVTKCHVLNSEESVMRSRLVLIEGTRSVMALCFNLLGIEPLERI